LENTAFDFGEAEDHGEFQIIQPYDGEFIEPENTFTRLMDDTSSSLPEDVREIIYGGYEAPVVRYTGSSLLEGAMVKITMEAAWPNHRGNRMEAGDESGMQTNYIGSYTREDGTIVSTFMATERRPGGLEGTTVHLEYLRDFPEGMREARFHYPETLEPGAYMLHFYARTRDGKVHHTSTCFKVSSFRRKDTIAD
jgi:hypothetical protein